MSTLRIEEKQKLHAGLSYCGFASKLSTDTCQYTGSLVGRDFKALAQMAPFVILSHVDESVKPIWVGLSKVKYITDATNVHTLHIELILIRVLLLLLCSS